MKFLYRTYQLFICAPIIIISLIILTGATVIGTHIANPNFWAYHPGRLWCRIIVRVLFLPVKVEGRENLPENKSFVFVSNHQGAFDIFLIYGFLNRNFKWMMKYQLMSIPFIGATCRASKHIVIDKRGPHRIKASYDQARETLCDGMSLVLFPEGSRSKTGKLTDFRRGGYLLADELQLPVVPLTINGSYEILRSGSSTIFVNHYPLTLTIHRPIYPETKGDENVHRLMTESRETIYSALAPQYRD